MKLEIGPYAGRPKPKGWLWLDVVKARGVDVVARWGRDRLPFKAGTFSLVFADAVLEYVPWWEVDQAVSEAARILRPGGALEVWVPDVDACVKRHQEGSLPEEKWRKHNPHGDPMTALAGRLLWGARHGDKDGEPHWHKSLYNEAYVRRVFARAGLKAAERLPPRKRDAADHRQWPMLGMKGIR